MNATSSYQNKHRPYVDDPLVAMETQGLLSGSIKSNWYPTSATTNWINKNRSLLIGIVVALTVVYTVGSVLNTERDLIHTGYVSKSFAQDQLTLSLLGSGSGDKHHHHSHDHKHHHGKASPHSHHDDNDHHHHDHHPTKREAHHHEPKYHEEDKHHHVEHKDHHHSKDHKHYNKDTEHHDMKEHKGSKEEEKEHHRHHDKHSKDDKKTSKEPKEQKKSRKEKSSKEKSSKKKSHKSHEKSKPKKEPKSKKESNEKTEKPTEPPKEEPLSAVPTEVEIPTKPDKTSEPSKEEPPAPVEVETPDEIREPKDDTTIEDPDCDDLMTGVFYQECMSDVGTSVGIFASVPTKEGGLMGIGTSGGHRLSIFTISTVSPMDTPRSLEGVVDPNTTSWSESSSSSSSSDESISVDASDSEESPSQSDSSDEDDDYSESDSSSTSESASEDEDAPEDDANCIRPVRISSGPSWVAETSMAEYNQVGDDTSKVFWTWGGGIGMCSFQRLTGRYCRRELDKILTAFRDQEDFVNLDQFSHKVLC